MGSNSRYRDEAPAHEVTEPGFWIDTHEVTNQQFSEFVEATGYITTAERQPDKADYPDVPADKLVPGSALFVPPVGAHEATLRGHWTQWWQFVPGASWKTPDGPQSNLQGRAQHPVVHVSYLDALAYARWRGRSIPSEAQWELAAQGVRQSDTSAVANTWQGFFPVQDKALDGFAGSAPVGCFPANSSGVHDMIGNVWEWVADDYRPGHQPGKRSPETVVSDSNTTVAVKVIKGGSYLCASNYCRRDAPQSRQPQEEDFGSGHIGFRTIRMVSR